MTIILPKLPPRIHASPIEAIPKCLLEIKETTIPDTFKSKVLKDLKPWQESSKISDKTLLDITNISYNILTSDSIKNPSFAKKGESRVPYSIITSVIPKEVYFELDEYTDHKTGQHKKGSQALRITMKKASLVWQLTSNRVAPFNKHVKVPYDFILSTKEKPRICPKPYGHFISIESEKSVIGIKQVTFSEQFKYDLYELSLTKVEAEKTKESLTYDQLFTITKQLFQALNKIHAQDKSHGDIKPENIVVSESKETAVFIDFDTLGPKISSESAAYGTAAFSGYEYLQPEPLVIDLQKADLYALGVTIQIALENKELEWFDDLDTYFSDDIEITVEAKNLALEGALSSLLEQKEPSEIANELLKNGCKKSEFLGLLSKALYHPDPAIRPDAKTVLSFYEKFHEKVA